MSEPVQNQPRAEDKAIQFFRRVQKELRIRSTKKLVELVGRVLYYVRSAATVQPTLNLLRGWPRLFQLLVIKDWRVRPPENSYAHLDELADRIYAEDRASGSFLFHNELEALNAVIVILSKLDKYLDLFSYKILKQPLITELSQIQAEDIL